MKTELFIARRLRLDPGDGRRRSPAVGIAVGGVALAVAVLMISMAVVLGFQDAIRDKVMGFEASLTVRPAGSYSDSSSPVIRCSAPMADAIREAIPDAAVAVAVSQPVILKTLDNFAGVVLKAYGEGHDDAFERGNLLEGNLPGETTEIAVSAETASKLGIRVGDRVDGCFFIDNTLRLRRLTVSGIYSSHFSDYDRLTAYVAQPLLSRLRRLEPDEGDIIEIRGVAAQEIPAASLALQESLSRRYVSGELTGAVGVTTVFDSGAIYFNWLALLDANVIVILIIMSLISGFTLISCVFILILQRIRMIGVLKSIGATDGQIRRVFMLLGGRVVGLGLLLGNLIGLALIFVQWRWHPLSLNPEAYFLTYVPVELTWTQILVLNAGAVLLAGILMLLPASLVSRISPARTMHYE